DGRSAFARGTMTATRKRCCLRQDRGLQTGVTGKALVEGDYLVIPGERERRQEGVIPDVRRECGASRQPPPVRIEARGLVGEGDPRVGQHRVVQLPRPVERDRVRLQHYRIGGEPKEPLLRHATEEA